MSIADIPQLQNLTDQEKLQLADELIASVDPNFDGWTISEEEKRMLDERLAEAERDPACIISLEEFKRRVAERL